MAAVYSQQFWRQNSPENLHIVKPIISIKLTDSISFSGQSHCQKMQIVNK